MHDIHEILLRQPNYRLLFMDEPSLREALKKWSRQDLIDWLSWNDPNGVYCDDESMAELGNTMTYEEGIELVVKQVTTHGQYTNRHEVQKLLFDSGLIGQLRS
jgi:hypothetical protein